MVFLKLIISANKESLKVLNLRICMGARSRDSFTKAFKDIATTEKLQLGLIRTIKQLSDLHKLTVPVWLYSPMVLCELASVIEKQSYL